MFLLYTVRPGGSVLPRVIQAFIDIMHCDSLEYLAYVQGFTAEASDGRRNSYIWCRSPETNRRTLHRLVWGSLNPHFPATVFLHGYTSPGGSDSYGRDLVFWHICISSFFACSRLGFWVPFGCPCGLC